MQPGKVESQELLCDSDLFSSQSLGICFLLPLLDQLCLLLGHIAERGCQQVIATKRDEIGLSQSLP